MLVVVTGKDTALGHLNTFTPTATIELCARTGANLGSPCSAGENVTPEFNADLTITSEYLFGQILPSLAATFVPPGAAIPGPETNALCANASDDDGDTKVNDGCPPESYDLEKNRCDGNAANDDSPDDTLVNDGCPAVAFGAEAGSQCQNIADDDADGAYNDGCPSVGVTQSETSGWCSGDTNEDARDDAAGGGQRINDGCPALGAAAETACADSLDDDADTKVNDGCPAFGGIEAEVNECDNAIDDDAEDGIVNDGCPEPTTNGAASPQVGATQARSSWTSGSGWPTGSATHRWLLTTRS